MARKNIQISQLKSELTDAQRRLTVLESDPGASNANTLVYEQKYNDVKKQYVSPTNMFCLLGLWLVTAETTSSNG